MRRRHNHCGLRSFHEVVVVVDDDDDDDDDDGDHEHDIVVVVVEGLLALEVPD